MAHGDFIAGSREFFQWKALDAATGNDNGQWVDVATFSGQINFHTTVTSTLTGTLNFIGSNAATKPANGTGGPLLGVGIPFAAGEAIGAIGLLLSTAVSGHYWTASPRWVKATVTGAAGSGTISVNCITRISG